STRRALARCGGGRRAKARRARDKFFLRSKRLMERRRAWVRDQGWGSIWIFSLSLLLFFFLLSVGWWCSSAALVSMHGYTTHTSLLASFTNPGHGLATTSLVNSEFTAMASAYPILHRSSASNGHRYNLFNNPLLPCTNNKSGK